MSDYGAQITDKSIAKLDRKIKSVYKEAADEIQEKMDKFFEKYKIKEAIKSEQLKNGEITKADYDSWVKGQVFQSEQWKSKKNEVLSILTDSNKIATQMINGESLHVFSENANYMSYTMDSALNFEFGNFTVYDSHTVSRLIKEDRKLLPEWKINKPKDYAWNNKKVNRQITQGIIQGESLDKIAKRLSSNLSSQNFSHMRTFARTAMTGAQNAGREESLRNANALGINVMKMWMATLDGRTRDSHRHLDGEKIPVGDGITETKFSNGLRYPADPEGPAHEVYNCRCTLVGDIEGLNDVFSRRDNITGEVVNKLGPDTVENLTYDDWKMTRGVTETAKYIDKKDKVTETLQEIVGLGTGHLEGLPFKYKGFDSAFRKIVGDTKEEIAEKKLNLSKSEIKKLRTTFADKTSDALRFTSISSTKNLVNDYNLITNELEKRGFKTVRVKNTLGDSTAPYRGINTLVKTPSGYVIEMQYHTPQSLEIKEINHKLYEDVRKLDKNNPRVKTIENEMAQNSAKIVSPEGINSIQWIKFDTNTVKNVSPFGKYW